MQSPYLRNPPINASSNCQSAQLKSSTPDGPDGGLGHFAYVYQVMNSSRRSCTLNGVPRLHLFDKQNREWKIPICANCSDYMFTPRPAELINLRPGESAHILFGIDVVEGPGHDCRRITRLQVFPEEGRTPMTFHFGAASSEGLEICDKLSMSAWQAGAYKDE
jgi:hypothetical protein